MTNAQSAYAQSGVDINEGQRFAEMIADRVRSAWPDASVNAESFSGAINLPPGTQSVRACADGSGTVAILCALTGDYETLGINAAAMSLVDAYVSGAMPMGLVDVIDVAKLDSDVHIEIVDGFITACQCSGPCQLIGGETAELPDMFRYDWMVNVNTMVVSVPVPGILAGEVQPGCSVYGWPSNGPGSNGFSLIRKIFQLSESDHARRMLRQRPAVLSGESLADALLEPVPVWINAIEEERVQRNVRFAAHAHITGGGLVENIPRVLPADCKVVLNRSMWERPPIFRHIQQHGNVDSQEMDRVFNQGVMVASIVALDSPQLVHPSATCIGRVEQRVTDEPQVEFTGMFTG